MDAAMGRRRGADMRNDLDVRLLRVLQELGAPSDFREIVETIMRHPDLRGVREIDIREALWRLIDEKRVRLTPQRKVTAVA